MSIYRKLSILRISFYDAIMNFYFFPYMNNICLVNITSSEYFYTNKSLCLIRLNYLFKINAFKLVTNNAIYISFDICHRKASLFSCYFSHKKFGSFSVSRNIA